MRRLSETPSLGFSLLELMIAVGIVAILAAIAVPGYQDQLRKARRADAQAALLAIAMEQERYRAQCTRYAARLDGAPGCAPGGYVLGMSQTSPEGYYRLAVAQSGVAGFTATATALGPQASDRSSALDCRLLSLDQDGHREPPDCWR